MVEELKPLSYEMVAREIVFQDNIGESEVGGARDSITLEFP